MRLLSFPSRNVPNWISPTNICMIEEVVMILAWPFSVSEEVRLAVEMRRGRRRVVR